MWVVIVIDVILMISLSIQFSQIVESLHSSLPIILKMTVDITEILKALAGYYCVK